MSLSFSDRSEKRPTQLLFRICFKPPPLQSQAQEVQWRLTGHDDGGAPGGRGAEQQYNQVN